MGKDLSEMTLEELWELFPIFLVAHDDRWKDSFKEIEKTLTGLLSYSPVVRISHIGSTAIQGIWAKNIIDVMIEISQSADMKDIAQILEKNGFIVMSAETNRVSLNKGYTENGFADKVLHVHLRYTGDNDELYFRDYLNEHSDVAKEYEALKLRLWKQYEHNRDAYTDEEAFKQTVDHVTAVYPYTLIFHLRDGRDEKLEWQNRSRAESWTPEMKERARKAARRKNNGKNSD